VDYAAEDEGVLGGRGTSTLVVKGATIHVDATALSSESIGLDGIDWFPNGSVLTLTLLPGRHSFYTPTHLGGPNYTWFVIKRDLTVDYEHALNSVLAGRGTNTLLVRGAVIFVDARIISNGLLSVDVSGSLTTRFMVPYALMPGSHELWIYGSGTNSVLLFGVSNDGAVSYRPDMDGTVFSGRGTNTLVLLSTLHIGQLQDPEDSTPEVRLESALRSPLEAPAALGFQHLQHP
jgi:hypothetical protein